MQRHPATSLAVTTILLVVAGASYSLLRIVSDAEDRLSWIQKENLILQSDVIGVELAIELRQTGVETFDAGAFVQRNDILWKGWSERSGAYSITDGVHSYEFHGNSEARHATHSLAIRLDLPDGRSLRADRKLPSADSLELAYFEQELRGIPEVRRASVVFGIDASKFSAVPSWWKSLMVPVPIVIGIFAAVFGIGAIVAGLIALQRVVFRRLRTAATGSGTRVLAGARTVLVAILLLGPVVVGSIWLWDRRERASHVARMLRELPLTSTIEDGPGESYSISYKMWSIEPYGVCDYGRIRLAFLGETFSGFKSGSSTYSRSRNESKGTGRSEMGEFKRVEADGVESWTFRDNRFVIDGGRLRISGQTFDVLEGSHQVVYIDRSGSFESVRKITPVE